MNATIFDLKTARIITAGLQSGAVCDAAINAARRIARERHRSVIVEDYGTHEVYRVTPAGHIWRAPKGWGNPFDGGDE
jgi:streptogramin lyase